MGKNIVGVGFGKRHHVTGQTVDRGVIGSLEVVGIIDVDVDVSVGGPAGESIDDDNWFCLVWRRF